MKKITLLTITLIALVVSGCATKSYTRDEITFQEGEFAILSKESMKPITGTLITEDRDGEVRGINEMKNGMPHGKTTIYNFNGNIFWEIYFKNGKLEGVAKMYDNDGDLSAEYSLKNDKLHGISKAYDKGLVIVTRNHIDGKADGETIITDETDDNYSIVATYKDGVVQSGSVYLGDEKMELGTDELEELDEILYDFDNEISPFRFVR